MGFAVPGIVVVAMNSTVKSVRVDDWTADFSYISSNGHCKHLLNFITQQCKNSELKIAKS